MPLSVRRREVFLFFALGIAGGWPGVPGGGAFEQRVATLVPAGHRGERLVTRGKEVYRRQIAGPAGVQILYASYCGGPPPAQIHPVQTQRDIIQAIGLSCIAFRRA